MVNRQDISLGAQRRRPAQKPASPKRLQRHGAGDVVGGGLAVEVDDALVGAAAEEEVGVALLQNEGLAFFVYHRPKMRTWDKSLIPSNVAIFL